MEHLPENDQHKNEGADNHHMMVNQNHGRKTEGHRHHFAARRIA